MSPSRHSGFKIALGLAAIYLIWGSTYLAIRFGVESLPPFLMTGIRFVAGGLLLYSWARWRGASGPRASHWRPALILGLLMPAGGTGLVSWAEQTVPSGLTALLVAMAPMWMVLFDWIRPRGVRPGWTVTFGMVLGFAGVALLINPTGLGGVDTVDLLGALAIVLATISWAAGTVYSRHAHQPHSKVLAVGMQMIAGGGGLLISSALVGEWSGFDFGAVSLKSWLALGYLTTIGSIAFAIYMWLVSATTVARASTYAYVNPVVALALGSLVAGETLSGWTLGCSALIVLAVVIIITAKRHVPKKVAKPAVALNDQTAACIKPCRLGSEGVT